MAQCKAKLAQLSIKDMTKVLPLCKLSTSKNEVFFLNDLIEKYDFDEERERVFMGFNIGWSAIQLKNAEGWSE